MSLGVESYSCILLATRNGNQQEAERRSGCCCHQGKRVAARFATRVLNDPRALDQKPEAHTQRGQYFREQWVGSRRHARDIPEDDPVTGILLLWETYGQTVLLHNSLLQPARRRYVLTSSEQGSSACSQTSIMHHW